MEDGIDMDSMEKGLVRERERGRESRSFEMECCIFIIPNEVSVHNDKAYSPHAFSIGPFHSSNPRTMATHTIKLRYFDDLLSRFGNGVTPRYLIEAVNLDYDRALGHYERRVDNMSREEFIKILVLDGCFIIELLLKNMFIDRETKEGDPIFSVPRLRQHLNHDLILLENQLPWMVLKTLFHATVSKHRDDVNLVYLNLKFFAPVLFAVTHLEVSHYCFEPERTKHILDLLREALLWCLPKNEIVSSTENGNADAWLDPVMLSATALEESGIRIQSVLMIPRSILDVEFNDGVLEIPQVKVHEASDALFRNLVALELYCPNYEDIITSYVKLFDDLVQTTADMKLLCDRKVVHNMLRLDKATRIFNQTTDGQLDVKESYYYKLIQKLDQYGKRKRGYYMRRWRVYKRELKLVYFSHPWASISTVAASLILIFTFVQTIFTIMSYKSDSNGGCPCLGGKQP